MAIAELGKNFLVSAVNPLFEDGSAARIEREPDFFWQLSEKRGTFLGEVTNGWFGVVPENQSVPEEGKGVHLMIAPRRPTFVTPSTLTHSELETGASFAVVLVNYARQQFPGQIALAGWNISEDPKDRKIRPQSWPNFHIHGMVFPSELMALKRFPRAFRDMGRDNIEGILSELMDVDYQDRIEQVNIESQRENFGRFLPRGGILYRLKSVDSSTVAMAMRKLHEEYRRVHREVFSLFVSNYNGVKNSHWLRPYELRSPSDFTKKMSESDLSQQAMETFYQYRFFLKDEASIKRQMKLYRSPSYSTALFVGQDGSLYMFFHPHIVRISGFPHAVGIDVMRQQVDGVSLAGRLSRAQSLFEEVVVQMGQTNLRGVRQATS